MNQEGQIDGRTPANRQDRQDSFRAPDKDGLGRIQTDGRTSGKRQMKCEEDLKKKVCCLLSV